jgi:alcohol dehydrogenase (cytochrome c)
MKLIAFALVGFSLAAQGLDPAQLLKLPTNNWPTYNGDYSGRRFSPLARINS